MRRLAVTGALSAVLSLWGNPMLSQETTFAGKWLVDLTPAGAPSATVHLTLVRSEEGVSTPFHVPLAKLEGLSAGGASSPGGVVRFRLRRDAGTFDMEGWLKAGQGAGSFSFSADPAFAAELAERGIGRPAPREQFALALHDIGLDLVDELAAQGYGRPTTGELVQAGTQGVKLGYLRELGALGYRLGSVRALIDLQNQAVTPQFIREIASLGYPGLSVRDLLELQNHGVRPAFVRELKAAGYGGLSVNELVELANHGITPRDVRRANEGRARRRTVGELVGLRVAGSRG